MAGDWIKWAKGLTRKPEVIRMAFLLKVTRREVASMCMEFWEWCDENISEDTFTESGSAFVTLSPHDGDNMAFVDAAVGTVKFADSLSAVGWIRFRDGRIELPNFALHNGETAKTRARNAKNQKKKRSSDSKSPKTERHSNVIVLSPQNGDKTVTREEKRRVSNTDVLDTPPNPPQGEDVGESHPNVTMLSDSLGTFSFDEDPSRWVAEFIRRWNRLPGVSKHSQSALSQPNYVELRKRLSDSGWDWKAAFLMFPLSFPDGKSPNISFFLKFDTVSKILDNTYAIARTEQAGLFSRRAGSAQEATRIRTGETEAYIASAFAQAAASSGGQSCSN